MSYLETLNEEQRAVVYETEGYKAVVASAGAGKTRVVIAKIIHLIQDKGILPSTIWVCTFTKKAKNRGMTTKAFMKEVLSNPENYTMKTRRQAQLMKNMM